MFLYLRERALEGLPGAVEANTAAKNEESRYQQWPVKRNGTPQPASGRRASNTVGDVFILFRPLFFLVILAHFLHSNPPQIQRMTASRPATRLDSIYGRRAMRKSQRQFAGKRKNRSIGCPGVVTPHGSGWSALRAFTKPRWNGIPRRGRPLGA